MNVSSLQLFLRVAELGSVSQAARDMNLSVATASARLASLEKELGIRLFNRTTRATSLTTDGAAFKPYIEEMIETLAMGISAAGGQGSEPQGVLRMTLPGSFGRMHVIPLLAEFRTRYPKVQLDLRLSDEVLNVVEGAYDLIIRNAALDDSSMVAKKLAEDRRILVAAPAYLEERGTPQQIQDLAEHDWVNFTDVYRLKFEDGTIFNTPRQYMVNDGEAMRAMIESGMGIGFKSLWNASGSLKAGRLVQVLPEFPMVTTSSIWAIYPGGRVMAPKVRVMIDFLMEQYQPHPPWEDASH